VIYDIYGKAVTQFHLFDKQSTSNVSECHFWGDGVAVLTSDMSVFVAEVAKPKMETLCATNSRV
jgi:hypothetical protein